MEMDHFLSFASSIAAVLVSMGNVHIISSIVATIITVVFAHTATAESTTALATTAAFQTVLVSISN
jgi:hypothetical protein